MKKKVKKEESAAKIRKKLKKKVRVFALNFYTRILGMIQSGKPLPIHLVKYYMSQVEEHFRYTKRTVKLYIEDPAGYTKEQIIPIIASLPQHSRIKFIWGKRKVNEKEKKVDIRVRKQFSRKAR